MTEILQLCTAIMCLYHDKSNLTEFEMLVYEQACRLSEDILKEVREAA